MKIRTIKIHADDTKLSSECDAYIAKTGSSDYSSSSWRTILHTIYGRKSLRLCAIDQNNQIIGHCLAYHKGPSSTLYTTRFGILADHEAAAQAIASSVKEYCKEESLSKALLNTGSHEYIIGETSWQKINLLLPLAASNSDDLFSLIPKKTRNMIKKAQNSDLEIVHSNSDVANFYPIYRAHMLRKNLNLKPISYFKTLENIMGNRLDYFSVVQNSATLGFMVFLRNNGTASYLYNVCEHSAAQSGANNLMMWHAMSYYQTQGIQYIELGESTKDSPVYNFKKRLHKDIITVPIHYMQMNFKTGTNYREIISGKLNSLTRRLLPFLPASAKASYLIKQDRSGRVI